MAKLDKQKKIKSCFITTRFCVLARSWFRGNFIAIRCLLVCRGLTKKPRPCQSLSILLSSSCRCLVVFLQRSNEELELGVVQLLCVVVELALALCKSRDNDAHTDRHTIVSLRHVAYPGRTPACKFSCGGLEGSFPSGLCSACRPIRH